MTKREPEQFTLDREDKLRNELQGKIDKIDLKIDQKVSNHVLYWITPIAMLILAGIFGFAFTQMSKLNDKVDSTNERLARMEVKIEVATR
jgi:hypothetical protein